MTVDYTAIGDAITAQLTAALPIALGLAGTILAVTVGVKLFKRFAK